jgi:hypothetical protein
LTQTREPSATDDLAYLKACAALGLDPTTREKNGNGKLNGKGRLGGIKVPKSQQASNGESLAAMTRRREQERKQELREAWIDHWYREIDAAYHRYISIKARNLAAIAALQGSRG